MSPGAGHLASSLPGAVYKGGALGGRLAESCEDGFGAPGYRQHEFGLETPVSETVKHQKTLQLEQEVRNQDKLISTLELQIEDLQQISHSLEECVRKLLESEEVVSSQTL